MPANSILVTGVSGLIGYAVAQRLHQLGHDVVGIDQNIPQPPLPVPFMAAELADIHRLYNVLRQHPVQAIVHCGAVSGPMLARENPYYICTTNVTGTANILEAARVLDIKRVVYCSSCTTYGNTPPAPVTEAAPQRPTSVYAASKAAGEQLVMAYSNEHGLEGVSLRLSWVYGPRRWTDCLIRTMISDALDGKPTRLDWGGDFYRQYVYLDDVVSALLLALQADHLSQPVYNITGGSYLTIGQIAACVREVLPQAEIDLGPGADPVDSIQEHIDISAAERDLGYRPQISLRQGIELYRQWLLEQRQAGNRKGSS